MATVRVHGQSKEITVSKVICIGRNFADHAKEMGAPLPEAPVFFLKPSTALLRDGGTVQLPSISTDVHHEVEMTVLLGKGGKNIPLEQALSHIAGYGIGLDLTMRDIQAEAKKKGLPWTLAKGFDTSAPISSFAQATDVHDPHDLGVQLKVNGAVRQQASTTRLIFRLEELISYVSTFITLEEGDIFFTGTPEGVAQIHAGDLLEAQLTQPSGALLASLTVRVQ